MKTSIALNPDSSLVVKTRLSASRQKRERRTGSAVVPEVSAAQLLHLLDINDEFQEQAFRPPEKKAEFRPGWGLPSRATQFTPRAKSRILQAGGAIDRERIPSVLATGTLPGSTPEAIATFAMWSGWVSNRCLTWLRDQADRLGCDRWVFGCWEWQTRGALHIHLVIASRDPDLLAWASEGWKSFWASLIDQISEKTGVDLWASARGYSHADYKTVLQTDVQPVVNSVTSYIAKYVGKGSEDGNPEQAPPYPSRWWVCTRNTLELIRKWTFKEVAEFDWRIEDDILTRIQSELEPLAISLKVVKRKYSQGWNYYYLIDRERFHYCRGLLTALTPRSSCKLGVVSMDTLLTKLKFWAIALYEDPPHRDAFYQAVGLDVSTGIKRCIQVNGIYQLSSDTYALMAFYSTFLGVNISLQNAINLFKNGELCEYLRQINDGPTPLLMGTLLDE